MVASESPPFKISPVAAIPADGGGYALLLMLPEEAGASVGRLGSFMFPQGYYVYLGSARRGLRARIGRHMRDEKARHWHIDYFPRRARMIEIWYALSQERLECGWASALRALPGASPPVPGFGSADCRCSSHLIHFASPPSFADFALAIAEHSPPPVRVTF